LVRLSDTDFSVVAIANTSKGKDMTDQKTKWHETRKVKMDELFAGKQYSIIEEKKFDEPQETPLGYKVKSGYIVESSDGSQRFVIGKALLNKLAEEYNAIEKPAAKKRGRPPKQPLAQAEEWAGRDMPNDASPITQAGPTMTNPNADQHLEG
jgi:hypothetical protein